MKLPQDIIDKGNVLKAAMEIFKETLLAKAKQSELKYGYKDNWLDPTWEAECRKQLMHHIEKGDPRDVAIYAAFMWFHDWSTTPTPKTRYKVTRRYGNGEFMHTHSFIVDSPVDLKDEINSLHFMRQVELKNGKEVDSSKSMNIKYGNDNMLQLEYHLINKDQVTATIIEQNETIYQFNGLTIE